jgi:hypothetical protein
VIENYRGARSRAVPWLHARCKKRYVSSMINVLYLYFALGAFSYLFLTDGPYIYMMGVG